MTVANMDMRPFKQPSQTFGPYDAGAPKVAPDTSTPARCTAVAIENAIRRDALETGVFIAADGRELLRRQGTPDRVAFTHSELLAIRGTTFTHNHPGGAGFSVDDFSLASEFGLAELRAVTLEFRHMASGIPLLQSAQWLRAYAAAEAQIAPAMVEKVRLGEFHPKDFGYEVRHRAWSSLAQSFKFWYAREKS